MTDFSQRIASGELSARMLAEMYLERIAAMNQEGPQLHAIIELNPAALQIADQLDTEQLSRGVRGPLHGIPVLIKDNIDTGDEMMTTAGSLALVGTPAAHDAPLVSRLREAGMVLLGKTNLSEWANFRSTRSCSGWSGRGRQTVNPHVLDRSPSGSSSGSAVAVASGLALVAVGTETDGSVVSPSSQTGIVGFKPSVGRISRDGIIPVAMSQDTAGAHGKSVADVVALYTCIADRPETIALDPGSLKGRRIGVLREPFSGYSEHADRVYEQALLGLRSAGAILVDPIEMASAIELRKSGVERTIMLHEFKAGLNRYLKSRTGVAVRSLAELIEYNLARESEEMPYFRQELLEEAEATTGLSNQSYLEARHQARMLAAEEGIDAVTQRYGLDALVAITSPPACVIDPIGGDKWLGGSAQPAAVAGYPHITVPAGFALEQLPVGISFFSPPSRETQLLSMAFAYEQTMMAHRSPRFRPTFRAP